MPVGNVGVIFDSYTPVKSRGGGVLLHPEIIFQKLGGGFVYQMIKLEGRLYFTTGEIKSPL